MFLFLSFHFPQRLPPVTSFKWLCVHLSYIDASILICLIFPSRVSLNCGIFFTWLPPFCYLLLETLCCRCWLFVSAWTAPHFSSFPESQAVWKPPDTSHLIFSTLCPSSSLLVLFASRFHHSLLSVALGHFTQDVAACWAFSSSPCSNSWPLQPLCLNICCLQNTFWCAAGPEHIVSLTSQEAMSNAKWPSFTFGEL